MTNTFKKNQGFSLIELAVGLAILGVMVAGMLQTYMVYKAQRVTLETLSLETPVRSAMERFFVQNGRYPCPADPGIDPWGANSASLGVEQCTVFTDNLDPNYVAIGACGGIEGGLCHVDGMRDADGSNGGMGPDANDSVYIGAVPYVTIGLAPQDTYDGWNQQLGYAITGVLTTAIDPFPTDGGTIAVAEFDDGDYSPDPEPDGFDGDDGALKCQFDFDNPNAPAPPVHCDFLVWSYGGGRRGAYTPAGVQTWPCGTGAPPNGWLDDENCDMDAQFLHDRFYRGGFNSPDADDPAAWNGFDGYESLRSTQRGANFYDSHLLFANLTLSADAWRRVNNGEIANSSETGRIGIGTANPQESLHVAGDARVPRLEADWYCDVGGSSGACFQSSLFGAEAQDQGTYCGTWPEIFPMAGVQGNQAVCPNQIGSGTQNSLCGAGEVAYGIDASGGILCTTP